MRVRAATSTTATMNTIDRSSSPATLSHQPAAVAIAAAKTASRRRVRVSLPDWRSARRASRALRAC
jgi:hypothetical protein